MALGPAESVLIKGSNMIVCVLLVSSSRGWCLAALGDHEGAAHRVIMAYHGHD